MQIDFDKVIGKYGARGKASGSCNVVMDQGRIAEFASPAELLRDHKSMFYAVNLTLT
jgi:hypothetical protein